MDRVLIVDDDIDILEMVCMMVMTHGIDALCVNSGEALLEALKNERFSMILMDIFMGDHDGRELARQIKESSPYKNIPILLYSAGSVDPKSIVDSKADGFLPKPFNMPELISRIKNLMVA